MLSNCRATMKNHVMLKTVYRQHYNCRYCKKVQSLKCLKYVLHISYLGFFLTNQNKRILYIVLRNKGLLHIFMLCNSIKQHV